jgi:hypothetical protein
MGWDRTIGPSWACGVLIASLLMGVTTGPASAQSLRGSRASVDRQNREARQHDFTFLRRPAQLERFVDAGLLVSLEDGELDVADYAHVPDGPGVMLIGHEADRAIDFGEGRPGVVYQRKRDLGGTLEQRFALTLEAVDRTAAEIEADPAAGGVVFDRDEILVRINDRLVAPNDDDTLAAIRPALEAAIAAVRPGRAARITRVADDPKGPFVARVILS